MTDTTKSTDSRIAEIKSKLKETYGGFFREDLVYLLNKVKRLSTEASNWASRTHEQDEHVTALRERIEKLERIREAAETLLNNHCIQKYREELRNALVDYEQAEKERGE